VPEAEKWKVKLNNWAKAHPEEYKAFLKDILEAFEKRTD
jgi:ABC-type nitrate/sulfonate/bicarbonate transport system substrate-binding protein